MKKIIALLLALTLVLTMVGCGGKKEYLAGTVSDTGVVAIGVPGQPANTDPALYDGSLAARAVLGMLYQGLTAVDENGQAVGAAAESWEISATDDAAKRPVYTFTLREGACWSDDTPVKAEDFITAWTRVISGAVDSPCRYLFDVILGARDYENGESELGLEATEDGKLVVTLEGDYSGFAHMLAAPAFWPIKEGEMAYNGRYALADITENVATLKPNTGYRGEKPAAGLALKYHYGDLAALETLAADGTLQATITGVAAFEAAYGGKCDDFADQAREYVQTMRNKMCDYFAENIPEMKIIKPEACFVCWCDCHGLGFEDQGEMMKFLAEAGVLMSNGLEYDKELGRGYVRIAYGFPEIQLMPALEKLAAAVKARRK